jgi:hypothetical protein
VELPSDPQAGAGIDDFPKADVSLETVQRTEKFPQVIESKEVDVSVTEPTTKCTAEEPPDDSYFYQSKKGHEDP